MKIICKRELLANSFGMTGGIVKAQSPKPILRNVKMEAHSDEIVLFATDMEVGLRITFPCDQVQEPGSVVMPADRLMMILKESREEFVTIESDGNKTIITAESRFVFPTEDPEEFPGTPVFSEENFLVTKARYVREAIRRTSFATDSESGRYALGGIFMDYKENRLNFVATDGRRMAVQQIEASVHGEYPEQKTAIATPRSLAIVDRLLVHGDADVSIALQDNCFMIQSENIFFYSSLLEGRFPEWRVGISQLREPKTLVLPMDPFSQAIRFAAVVTDNTFPGVILEFGEGKMTISAVHVERGEMVREFPVDYPDAYMALKLNGVYLSAFLRAIGDDAAVKMNFVDSRMGVLFETEDGYRYLVMPMQLDAKLRRNAGTKEASEDSDAE
ncbi:MAG: DNA polymerase III subunit beta [Thermoguttaceae bacterium]|nr:DNA polymerase III subunit beta [Thermoguttaceae bacterium]